MSLGSIGCWCLSCCQTRFWVRYPAWFPSQCWWLLNILNHWRRNILAFNGKIVLAIIVIPLSHLLMIWNHPYIFRHLWLNRYGFLFLDNSFRGYTVLFWDTNRIFWRGRRLTWAHDRAHRVLVLQVSVIWGLMVIIFIDVDLLWSFWICFFISPIRGILWGAYRL